MSNETERKNLQDLLMINGSAHIVYHATDISDIIHPFSVEGYETLTDEFVDFIEKYKAIIPEKTPILLQIVGKNLSEKEQLIVDRTIWVYFCMEMKGAVGDVKRCIKNSILYLLYTLLSSVLLFLVINETNEIIINTAYLIFWFFGYRFLIYMILDVIPTLKKGKWYRQLASVVTIFSGDKSIDVSNLDYEAIASEVRGYKHDANKEIREKDFMEKYLIHEGVIPVACNIKTIYDVLLVPELKGREFISNQLRDYLSQMESFFNPKSPITLSLRGANFNDEEKNRVRKAITNYYSLRIAEEDREKKTNINRIICFGFFALISAVVIVCWGSTLDVALHEFLVMLFYFFGDYLLEFVIIDSGDLRRGKRILNNCKNMTVEFDTK